jgi:hypothetical protein
MLDALDALDCDNARRFSTMLDALDSDDARRSYAARHYSTLLDTGTLQSLAILETMGNAGDSEITSKAGSARNAEHWMLLDRRNAIDAASNRHLRHC